MIRMSIWIQIVSHFSQSRICYLLEGVPVNRISDCLHWTLLLSLLIFFWYDILYKSNLCRIVPTLNGSYEQEFKYVYLQNLPLMFYFIQNTVLNIHTIVSNYHLMLIIKQEPSYTQHIKYQSIDIFAQTLNKPPPPAIISETYLLL